jgi:putative transcriptional regulator
VVRKEMPIRYKIDVLQALKEAGYNTNRIRQEKIMGQAVLQQLRNGELVSWANIDKICTMLNCQPGDIFEHNKERE